MAPSINKTAPIDSKRTRRRADPMIRLRAWVWLDEILWRTWDWDCSLRGLDRRLLGDKHNDLRAFWRVKRDGFDPGRKRASLGGRSLVEVVALQDGFEDTQAIYDHRLWRDVLGPTEMSADSREALIQELLHDLRLFQPDETDEFIATEMKLSLPALHSCTQAQFSAPLEGLTQSRSLDAILLLCLMYRRAMSHAHLEEAICLRDSIYFAIKHYCDRPGFDGQTSGIFLHLVSRRVFCGDRDVTPSATATDAAKQLNAAWREKAQTPRARRAVDTVEYLSSINFSIFDERKLFPLSAIDADMQSYLQRKPGLLELSLQKIQSRATARFKRAMKKQSRLESW